MISVFIVLAALIGAINAMNYFNIVKEADETLKIISENGGTMPSMQRRDMTEPPASSDKQKGGEGAYFSLHKSDIFCLVMSFFLLIFALQNYQKYSI